VAPDGAVIPPCRGALAHVSAACAVRRVRHVPRTPCAAYASRSSLSPPAGETMRIDQDGRIPRSEDQGSLKIDQDGRDRHGHGATRER
jgi:hypothetical protein